MTHEKHVLIAELIIRKGMERGFSAKQIAEAVVDRFEYHIELEIAESGTGVVTEFPMVSVPSDKEPNEKTELDRLAPPPIEPSSSLIIDPSAAEGRAIMEKGAPIRMPPPGLGKKPNSGPLRHWSQSQLRDFVEQNTPDEISVVPEGRESEVRLRRNIEVLPGVEGVRLSYSLGVEAHPAPSAQNSKNGETLNAISIDTPVFETFTTYEREQPIEAKLENIYRSARFVYRPRPGEIPSTTPRRSGFLGFNNETPHDAVGVTKNPFDGKEW